MQQSNMNDTVHWSGTGSVIGTSLSIILTFFAKFGLSDWAAIGAIAAGFTTAGLNLYKIWTIKKGKKQE